MCTFYVRMYEKYLRIPLLMKGLRKEMKHSLAPIMVCGRLLLLIIEPATACDRLHLMISLTTHYCEGDISLLAVASATLATSSSSI